MRSSSPSTNAVRLRPANAPPPDRRLHHGERLVDRDRGATLEHGASLGQVRSGVEGVRVDDRVAAGLPVAVSDRPVGADRLGGTRSERVPAVLERRAQALHPGVPGLHHGRLFLFALRHPTSAVQQQVVRHRISPLPAARCSPCRASYTTVSERLRNIAGPFGACRRQADRRSARYRRLRGYRYSIDMWVASKSSKATSVTPIVSRARRNASAPRSRKYSSFFPASM